MKKLIDYLVATVFGFVFGFLVAWGVLGKHAFYIFGF